MILFRCTLKKWAADVSGQGAFLYGGRWNTPGHYLIYTAENNLLAALEVAVRIPLTQISTDYIMLPVHISDKEEMYEPRLPKDWNRKYEFTQHIGNNFIENNKALVMKVPSALMNNTHNYLINPKHKNFGKVKVGKPQSLIFDERLLKMMIPQK